MSFTPKLLKPDSLKHIAKMKTDGERLDKEHANIRAAVLRFNQLFTELELALSALLYVILDKPDSQIAYAIYYSPTGFEARSEIVGNAVIQIASENPELAELIHLWGKISEGIDRGRKLRNSIAHSSPINMAIRKKNHARLAPPAFDVIRVGRKIESGQIPGLSANDINQGATRVSLVTEILDHVNRLIETFNACAPSLSDKFDALRAGLKKLDSR